jgi:3-methyladenine DNA glycosylase AlkC
MAEPLKNHFTIAVARRIADAIERVWPHFRSRDFITEAGKDFEAMELMARGRHIARVLRRYLPDDYPAAVTILLASVGERPTRSDGDGGMASFLYLPHVNFVAEFGLDHFDESMNALYVLTQRFTSEFSVRPFIERYEREALDVLKRWAVDPNVHVRRLVSEGTRPRLPWAGRLRRFQRDPSSVLALLELLKDDPEEYVRRSVANNLNDIGKDHPDVLVDVARRWLDDASPERAALVRHALRSRVKSGHSGALNVLGVGDRAAVEVSSVEIAPARVRIGNSASVAFTLTSTSQRPQRLLVDFRVHFVKANGSTSPKVFKLKTVDLPPGAAATFRKSVSLAPLTTRRPYPGRHAVDVVINGVVSPLGAFDVMDAP